MPQTTEAQKILRRGDVEKHKRMRRSSLYAAVAEGKFPAPIRLREKCVGWLESEIVDWQQRCIRERDARLASPRRQRRRRKIEGWPKCRRPFPIMSRSGLRPRPHARFSERAKLFLQCTSRPRPSREERA